MHVESVNTVITNGKKAQVEVNLILLGKGNVGSSWLTLFNEQKARYADIAQVKLVAVANSSRFMLNTNGLHLIDIDDFSRQSQVGSLSELVDMLGKKELPNVVVIDATASAAVTHSYSDFAGLGWNIVSANKIPMTISTERYKALVNSLKTNGCYWGINATVGAGLPVQSSLLELLQAGDTVMEISGVFSGSLSYLLVSYNGTTSFTDLIAQARDAGFTEPDPRDDLSGADVQKKLLILARLSGYRLNLSDIPVLPLLPKTLLSGELSDFWNNKTEIDQYMKQQFDQATLNNKKLVYQGKIQFNGKLLSASVGLEAVSIDNAGAQLSPSDNVFTLKTAFYNNNPLIIRGPGAGAIVTATAINIDLNKFITQLAVASELNNKRH